MQVNKNKMGMKGTARHITVERENRIFSFFHTIVTKAKSLVSKNNDFEEVKMERKEIKNFNRKVVAKREEMNTNVRMFMFSR